MKEAHQVSMYLLRSDAPYECFSPLGGPGIVVFRGTQTIQDLLMDDLDIRPVRWPSSRGGFVHGGFASRTQRLFEDLGHFVDAHDTFVLAGHSLGGACAILGASHLKLQKKKVAHVYTFGVPRLASMKFQDVYRRQGLWTRTTNFATSRDPVVTRIPYLYNNVGTHRVLDFDDDDAWKHHDMRTYEMLLSHF